VDRNEIGNFTLHVICESLSPHFSVDSKFEIAEQAPITYKIMDTTILKELIMIVGVMARSQLNTKDEPQI
jgi:hypothetical protein